VHEVILGSLLAVHRRAHRRWIEAATISAAAAYGGYALLRPRSGTISARPVDVERYFKSADLERARSYERGQLRLGAANTLLRTAALAASVRARTPVPLARTSPAAAAVRSVVLAGALTAQSLPLGAIARRRALRAGIATQSWRGWAFDVVRAGSLATAFAGAGGATICVLVRRFGERWWLAGSAAGLAAAGVLNFAGPVLLEPLFNDFTPLEDGPLRSSILEIAQRAGVVVRQVFTVDASRRTRALNAYVSGLGGTRRVVLFDTLLEAFSREQVDVVVAHELAHVRYRDVARGLVYAALVIPAATRAVAVISSQIDGVDANEGADLPALALASALVGLAVGPAARMLSRAVERRADSFSLELTGDPDAFIAFEQAITATNLADPAPSRWRTRLLATHPPAVERIGIAAAYAAGARATPRRALPLLRRRAADRPSRP
jgi:STE24 endopeptidase